MSPLEPDLRHGPAPGPLPAEGEPVVVERIRAEIAASGPLTFARFMELALYDPEGGYYRVGAGRPGLSGDFLTAPELHPIFGAAVAVQLTEVWGRIGRPEPFVVREFGSGSGALALAILRALAGLGPGGRATIALELANAIRYVPIEVDAGRRAELVDRLTADGFGASLVPEAGPDAVEPAPGAAIANEFFDALPVHRLEMAPDGLRELYVDWRGDAFVEVAGPPSSARLAERLAGEGIALAEGVRAEVCLALDEWVGRIAGGLERGAAILVDYGYPATELYGPARAAGTLRAYAGHRVHADWARAVGRQDLTAHVDFTALERAARDHGLDVLGSTTQAEFLAGSGGDAILDAIRSDPATTTEDWLAVRSALGRLLDPRAMGRFRVLVLGSGLAVDPPLRGLAYRVGRPLPPGSRGD